jgi:hypothetical protein
MPTTAEKIVPALDLESSNLSKDSLSQTAEFKSVDAFCASNGTFWCPCCERTFVPLRPEHSLAFTFSDPHLFQPTLNLQNLVKYGIVHPQRCLSVEVRKMFDIFIWHCLNIVEQGRKRFYVEHVKICKLICSDPMKFREEDYPRYQRWPVNPTLF